MNMVFPALIAVSVAYALFTGQVSLVGEAALSGAKDASILALTLLSNICLWSGFLSVCEESGLSDIFSKKIRLRRVYRAHHGIIGNISPKFYVISYCAGK